MLIHELKSPLIVLSDRATLPDLLPYNQEILLQKTEQKIKILKELELMSEFAICALKSAKSNAYHLFDAHIGESCCQVRAYFLQLFFIADDRKNKISYFLKVFYEYKEKLKTIVYEFEKLATLSSHYNKKIHSKMKFNDFLFNNNLLLNLKEEIVFLIAIFILCRYTVKDENGFPKKISYIQLSNEKYLSVNSTKKIIDHLQSKASIFSCKFIQKLTFSETALSKEKITFLRLISTVERDRSIYPCYLGMKAIMISSTKLNLPIVLIVENDKRQKKIILHTKDASSLNQLNKSELLHSPCLIVRGVTTNALFEYTDEYLKILGSVGIVNILLANMASHPQYSNFKPDCLPIHDGYKLNTINELQEEIDRMKAFSRHLGLQKCNSSIFYLKHVYCSSLKIEIQALDIHGILIKDLSI